MSRRASETGNEPDLRQQERRDFLTYVWGFVLALLLTLVPFAVVNWHVMPRTGLFITIGAFALVQLVVHFRFFLHITLDYRRDDFQLILFSASLLIIMVLATIWIMSNLAARMTPM